MMTLTEKRLTEVLEECKQFTRRAHEVRKLLAKDNDLVWAGNKVTGACRRASLDLSQALIDLRKVE